MKCKTTCQAMIVGVALLAGCAPSGTQPPSAALNAPDAGSVTVGRPTKKTLRRVIEQPASVEAFEETPLVAHISGYVDKVFADIGKQVKQGEVLAELAVPEMMREYEQKQALVKQARAEVMQASAALDAADAHVLTAQAGVREAEASKVRADANLERWRSEYVRIEDLVKQKAVDKQLRDEALYQFKAAEGTRQEIEAKVQSAQALAKESEAKRSKAKADVDAAKARVEVAQAEEGRLKALTDYRAIRAPYDGVVTRRNIHTGHYLQPNAAGGPSVLFVVARTDKLRIQIDIPEADAAFITEGQAAAIHVPALKDQLFTGKVTRTSWTLDAKSRTLRVEIDHPTRNTPLRPGMYANVVFTIEFADRLTLPKSALIPDQQACYRVEAGKAIRTPLKLGIRDGQFVEVRAWQAPDGQWQPFTGPEDIILTGLGAVSEGKDVSAPRK